MLNLLLVAMGGAFGAVARYVLNNRFRALLGTGWPSGIFTINVLGGFLMGCLVGALAHRGGAGSGKMAKCWSGSGTRCWAAHPPSHPSRWTLRC